MKFFTDITVYLCGFVTPRVGVWIEILLPVPLAWSAVVTPRVGVWIEIKIMRVIRHMDIVTPRVGVWIEISGKSRRGKE